MAGRGYQELPDDGSAPTPLAPLPKRRPCRKRDVRDAGAGEPHLPCYRLVTHPDCDRWGGGVLLSIERDGDGRPDDSVVELRCTTGCGPP